MLEWQADAKVNESQLDLESLKQANLHSKWLDHLTRYKVKCYKLEKSVLENRATLTEYYNGRMTKEELVSLGRPQYLHKNPLKSELEKLIESDQRTIELSQRLYYYKTLAEYCTSVLGAIRDRGFSIKTAVDFLRFAAGN